MTEGTTTIALRVLRTLVAIDGVEGRGRRVATIAESCGLSTAQVNRALRALAEKGLVFQVGRYGNALEWIVTTKGGESA